MRPEGSCRNAKRLLAGPDRPGSSSAHPPSRTHRRQRRARGGKTKSAARAPGPVARPELVLMCPRRNTVRITVPKAEPTRDKKKKEKKKKSFKKTHSDADTAAGAPRRSRARRVFFRRILPPPPARPSTTYVPRARPDPPGDSRRRRRPHRRSRSSPFSPSADKIHCGGGGAVYIVRVRMRSCVCVCTFPSPPSPGNAPRLVTAYILSGINKNRGGAHAPARPPVLRARGPAWCATASHPLRCGRGFRARASYRSGGGGGGGGGERWPLPAPSRAATTVRVDPDHGRGTVGVGFRGSPVVPVTDRARNAPRVIGPRPVTPAPHHPTAVVAAVRGSVVSRPPTMAYRAYRDRGHDRPSLRRHEQQRYRYHYHYHYRRDRCRCRGPRGGGGRARADDTAPPAPWCSGSSIVAACGQRTAAVVAGLLLWSIVRVTSPATRHDLWRHDDATTTHHRSHRRIGVSGHPSDSRSSIIIAAQLPRATGSSVKYQKEKCGFRGETAGSVVIEWWRRFRRYNARCQHRWRSLLVMTAAGASSTSAAATATVTATVNTTAAVHSTTSTTSTTPRSTTSADDAAAAKRALAAEKNATAAADRKTACEVVRVSVRKPACSGQISEGPGPPPPLRLPPSRCPAATCAASRVDRSSDNNKNKNINNKDNVNNYDRNINNNSNINSNDNGNNNKNSNHQCLEYVRPELMPEMCPSDPIAYIRPGRLSRYRLRHCCHHTVESVVQRPYRDRSSCVERVNEAMRMDSVAAAMSCQFDEVLARYDCKQQYSAKTCDSCKDAYALWACSAVLPHWTTTGRTTTTTTTTTTRTTTTTTTTTTAVTTDATAASTAAKRGRRYRVNACRSVCLAAEQTCPWLLPVADDSNPYAGEAAFTCMGKRG
ncbi:Frizzled domain [Cinara cedri]|uniref:Frizzled domain n=1 Tax=Cinara cedri TaxID=506608 RepID=A0A5E4NM33_9HEMI|nr:Frizzled domain [Cinara cedri]